MLEPNQRQHFLQAFHPPEGYELSFAIGTTYSLDLTALLNIPLAIAKFDWEDEEGRPVADPFAILEALRRYASRLHIFCQAGCIAVPQQQLPLFEYLENSIFQVNAPMGGVFHPKVWILRFTSPDQPIKYRFLCMSRNLTFDRSWDTILTLEGELSNRQKAYAAHHPLGDFIKALPGLAQSPISDQAYKNIEQAQYELRRVDFAIPDGFDQYGFWPMGIEGYARQWPFNIQYDRMLVVSPFLALDFLKRIAEQGRDHVLMSRLDSLSALQPEDFDGFKRIYSMNFMAENEEIEKDNLEIEFFETAPSGLHAKFFVADHGWNAHVWTGSANATHAAFNQNVEFLVELIGKKSVCGVSAFLDTTNEHSKFADLWLEFQPGLNANQPDPIQSQLEQILRGVQKSIVAAGWQGQVVPTQKANEFFLEVLPAEPLDVPDNIEVSYRLLTLSPLSMLPYHAAGASEVMFGPMATESISTFIVFQLAGSINSHSQTLQFVLHIPINGIPKDRPERLLLAMLKSREHVMRFLLFILADGQNEVLTGTVGGPGHGTLGLDQNKQGDSGEVPVFEAMLQALHRDPGRIDQIARTVEDLESTPEGKKLLPPEFSKIWIPIWEARQRMNNE